MNEFLVFFLHGLAYAGLLFLVSAGLTLVFGMMNVLNFAHAAMYMLGAYFSYTIVMQMTGQFWMALMICPVILFVIGALVEKFLLRRVHRYGHVQELLLTFGLAYIITELVKWYWGNYPLAINVSGFLNGTVSIFGLIYPIYRIFIFICAVLVGAVMSLIIYKTATVASSSGRGQHSEMPTRWAPTCRWFSWACLLSVRRFRALPA